MAPCRLFFFNDTATTEIYTLSLHDALPILLGPTADRHRHGCCQPGHVRDRSDDRFFHQSSAGAEDRKSTRLNSSHGYISYAVFCLKKKILSKTLATLLCTSTYRDLQLLARI